MNCIRVFFWATLFGLLLLCTLSSSATSQEKQLAQLATYRGMFVVKQGTTSDPSLTVDLVREVSGVAANKKISNHNRTLRVFLKDDEHHVSRVVIESAKPHLFYQLNGNYAVSSETATLGWNSETHLSFEGVSSSGYPTWFDLNIRDLIIHEEIISGFLPANQERVINPD